MTIASTTSKVSYNGSGSTGPFPITYKFTKNADITATKRSSAGVETVLALTTDYTLTGAGDAAGGALTLTVALAVGESLVIARVPGIVQEVDYVENSAFPAETHESALDLLTTICQSLQEQIDRAVKVEISSTTDPDDLLAELAADVVSAAASASTATTQAGLANTARIAAELAEMNAEAVVASVPTFAAFGETLAATTTASNARAALELGNAALLPVGTTAGTVAAGDDPRFSSGADTTARDLAVFNSLLNQIGLTRASGAVPSGYMHLFLTDELATKTGAYYDAAGDYYTNMADPATDVAPGATITYTGTVGAGTTAALVDGNNTTSFGLTSAAGNSFIFDFGPGGKNIRSMTYIINGGSISQDVKLQYSDLGVTYTDTNVTSAVAAVNPTGVTAAVNDYGAHRYWKISLNVSNNMQATTVNLLERIRGNMTLIPTAITAGAAPGTVDVYMLHRAVDATTLNTDLKARASRDNGTNWSGYVTLAEVCQYDADYKLLKGTADLSALASGTSVKWEITTLNAKAQRVRAAAMILNS